MSRAVPALLCVLAACTGATTAPDPITQVEIIGGDAQSGSPAYVLAESLAVRVLDAGGHPVANATITWGVEDRDASVLPTVSVTGADGVARTAWRLGRDDGIQHAKATLGSLVASRFEAQAVSGDVLEVAGTLEHQCGHYFDDVVRCWAPPDGGPARATALDTDIRFSSLAFAAGIWCGGTRSGAVACFDDADIAPGGSFRPEAAAVRVVATGVPVFSRIVGAGDPELGITWCATTLDLKVFCWGRNDSGEVGDGTVGGHRNVPAAVSGGLRALSIAVTPGASCAIDLAGAGWCWGSAAEGVVAGSGNSPVPIAVPGNFLLTQVAADGNGSMCAIDGGLRMICWGSGRQGGRGRAGVGAGPSPVQIEGTDYFVSVGSTAEGFLAVTVDRDLVVWGGLSGAGFTERPANVLSGFVFSDVIAGGGTGVICLHAYPSGARCVDRLGLARALSSASNANLIHGVPQR